MKKYLLICVMFLSSCGGASAPSHPASGGGTTYPITPTADANGTISPGGVTNVASGGTQAFSMSCNSGYQLASVTVDGSSAAVYSPYTFTNVTATHTITFTCSVVVTSDLLTAIANVSATYAAQAFRGTVYHYCDCGTGAAAGCVAGNDLTGDGSDAKPFKSIGFSVWVAGTAYNTGDLVRAGNADFISLTSGNTGNWPTSTLGTNWQYYNTSHHAVTASSLASTLAGTNTIAFCKGGVFPDVTVSGSNFAVTGCPAGTTCLDVREYASSAFTSSALPKISSTGGGFSVSGAFGGMRFMNFYMTGNENAKSADGFFFYGGVHDVVIGNVDINGYVIGIQNAGAQSGSSNTTFTIEGNRFVSNSAMAYLGGGNYVHIQHNYALNNGSSNDLDHTFYESAHVPTTDNVLSHNYIEGAYGGTCYGAPIVMHGGFINPVVSYNVIKMDAAHTSAGCWGIGTGNGAYSEASFLRNGLFVGNTIINSGNLAMSISGCTNCTIADNLIISNWTYAGILRGLMVPYDAARSQDDVSANNTIVNNTIWYGANPTGGAQAYIFPAEGSGNIVANNTVTFVDTTGTGYALQCYTYTGAPSTFAFINNNHCYSSATHSWEATQGSLASWKSYATTQGWDKSSIETAPNFVNAIGATGYDFHPNTGSPLIGAGSHANAPTYDLTGVSTFGNPPDIGAYTH